MITSSNPFRTTRGFNRFLTLRSRGINRGARKLAQTSTIIKKKSIILLLNLNSIN